MRCSDLMGRRLRRKVSAGLVARIAVALIAAVAVLAEWVRWLSAA